MFPARRILVGVDGRQGGRDALALARRLAAPQTEIVLAHVWHRDVLHQTDRSAEALALLSREAGRAGIPDATLDHTGDGRPCAGLRRLALRAEPDLVVLGASHRSVAGRLLVGDVGRTAVHELPFPVAIAPRGHRIDPPALVGVAWDASPTSRRALGVARELAAEANAEIQLFHVLEPPPVAIASPATPLLLAGARREELESMRATTTALGDRPGVVTVGPAASGLLRLTEDVDLLVVGVGRHGVVHRLLLGSHADTVLHDASCPVVLVPDAAAGTAPRQEGGAS